MDDKIARALLSGCPSLGPVRFRRLEEAFGSAVGAWEADAAAWASVEGIGPALAEDLAAEKERSLRRWEGDSRLMEKEGVRLVTPSDADYPENLKTLDDRPFILYMKGTWGPIDDWSVALVGTRTSTEYGRAVAERLARELAEAGVTVVSGLARGIDSAAHAAVVARKGRTAGVIGSGFGRFYPPENRALADKMAERGAVITEFAWPTEPLPSHFPRRNRLISGMSLGVVVVEADLKSGALITARLAADQGREVFAVPGSIFWSLSRGPHRLLKEGAKPVENAEDVLESLEVFRGLIRRKTGAKASPGPLPSLAAEEARLWEKLSAEPCGLDALAAATGLAHGALSAGLLGLELKGLVRALPGRSYVRAEPAVSGK